MASVTEVRQRLVDWSSNNNIKESQLGDLKPAQLSEAATALGVSVDAVVRAVLERSTSGFDASASPSESRVKPTAVPIAATGSVLPVHDVVPAPKLSVPTKQAVEVLASMANFFPSQGYGNVDYWLKTHHDLIRPARTLGQVFEAVAEHVKEPTVHTAMIDVARHLENLSGAGNGSSDYWESRVGGLVGEIKSASSDMLKFAAALPTESSGQVALTELLTGLSKLLKSLNGHGHGNQDYWSKTATDHDWITEGVGAAINRLAEFLPEPKRTVVADIGADLRALDSYGSGDVEYWYAKAGNIRDRALDLSSKLDRVISTL